MNEAYLDDEKFTVEDLGETAWALGYLGLVWSPQIAVGMGLSTGPLVVVEVALLAGLGASVAIGGVEGGVRYIDFFDKDIVSDPEKVDSLVLANRIVQGIMTFGVSEITRVGIDYLNEYKGELLKNRWTTGPYLPF